MTVIAWDGKTLAADKRSDSGGHINVTTKISRFGELLVGLTGNLSRACEMRDWFCAGADPKTYPAPLRDDKDYAAILVIYPGRLIRKYESGGPFPCEFEGDQFAMGSGRDYARAALHLGKSAAEAVQVACEFDPGCGNGFDILDRE